MLRNFNQNRAANVIDRKANYLLPCACGRDIPIEPRQAGETVRCQCGRQCAVPTMREVQSLRQAPASDTKLAKIKPAWGNPQRFLVTGLIVVLLAALIAIILYVQFPAHFRGLSSPETVRQRVKSVSTLTTMRYFHEVILPGIDFREQPEREGKRSMVYLGMATLAGVGAIGMVFVAIGITGIVRRR